MIIFSQDRNRLIDCKVIDITRNLGGGKDSKYVLTASTSAFNAGIIGSYPDEKSARDALEKIYDAFEKGATTYKVD